MNKIIRKIKIPLIDDTTITSNFCIQANAIGFITNETSSRLLLKTFRLSGNA